MRKQVDSTSKNVDVGRFKGKLATIIIIEVVNLMALAGVIALSMGR